MKKQARTGSPISTIGGLMGDVILGGGVSGMGVTVAASASGISANGNPGCSCFMVAARLCSY